jgi:hypothetical protein
VSAPRDCRDASCETCRVGAEIEACVQVLRHAEDGSTRTIVLARVRLLLHVLTDDCALAAVTTWPAGLEKMLEETKRLREKLARETRTPR